MVAQAAVSTAPPHRPEQTRRPALPSHFRRCASSELTCSIDARVPTRRFGKTGYAVPVVTCGGMRHASVEDLQAIVDGAMERGINHFETAAM
mmetsp:Transcript_15276/g.40336  ORF Transcript_15276/g.40336 Transcript_15276/m.40336 type:complete len:92 (-) Transcript_15276:1224-1499(-)